MRNLRLYAHGEHCLHDESLPAFVAGETMLRVKVKAIGVCSSGFDDGEEIKDIFSISHKFGVTISNHGS